MLLAVLGQACVSWPIRGDWVVQALKRQVLKQSITGKYETTDVIFLSTKTCKLLLFIRQNLNDEPEHVHNTSPLNQMSSSCHFSRMKQNFAGTEDQPGPTGRQQKADWKAWPVLPSSFFFVSASLWMPFWQARAGERERRKMNMRVLAKFSVSPWVFFSFSWPFPSREKKEWETGSEATKKKRIENKMLPVQDLTSVFVSLSLKEAGVPWSGQGQLFMMPRCHLTVPSWGAISNSDISWPLSAFLPVWCHGGQMSHRSSLCVHAAVFTRSWIRLNNAPLNPCGRFCREVTQLRRLA